jgi:hypothetical protein
MAFRHFPLTALMMVAAMNSCQSATSPGNAANGAPGKIPEITVKPNPAPHQRYQLTLTFAGLPAAVNELKGSLDFEVTNRDSVPLDYGRAVGGVLLTPQHSVPVEFTRSDDGAFTAMVNADALLNEDYYGLGVCEWSLISATVRFRSPTTPFVGGMGGDALIAGNTVTQHYLQRDFEHKPEVMDVVFGEDSATFYQTSAGPQFTLTISARKESP